MTWDNAKRIITRDYLIFKGKAHKTMLRMQKVFKGKATIGKVIWLAT